MPLTLRTLEDYGRSPRTCSTKHNDVPMDCAMRCNPCRGSEKYAFLRFSTVYGSLRAKAFLIAQRSLAFSPLLQAHTHHWLGMFSGTSGASQWRLPRGAAAGREGNQWVCESPITSPEPGCGQTRWAIWQWRDCRRFGRTRRRSCGAKTMICSTFLRCKLAWPSRRCGQFRAWDASQVHTSLPNQPALSTVRLVFPSIRRPVAPNAMAVYA